MFTRRTRLAGMARAGLVVALTVTLAVAGLALLGWAATTATASTAGVPATGSPTGSPIDPGVVPDLTPAPGDPAAVVLGRAAEQRRLAASRPTAAPEPAGTAVAMRAPVLTLALGLVLVGGVVAWLIAGRREAG